MANEFSDLKSMRWDLPNAKYGTMDSRILIRGMLQKAHLDSMCAQLDGHKVPQATFFAEHTDGMWSFFLNAKRRALRPSLQAPHPWSLRFACQI